MELRLAVLLSPDWARSLLTVREAISFARPSDLPRFSPGSLMCSYGRSRSPLEPLGMTKPLTGTVMSGQWCAYGRPSSSPRLSLSFCHELTPAAKGLWLKAMDSVEKGSWTEPFKVGRLSTYRYSTGNNTKRTMCVLTDDNNYRYNGKDYGRKGIIAAYWVNGRVGPGGYGKD